MELKWGKESGVSKVTVSAWGQLQWLQQYTHLTLDHKHLQQYLM